MISNKPWDDAKFTANQATKELKFYNSNYYTQDIHTIKIEGDSIFYENYYQPHASPEFRKTYRSTERIFIFEFKLNQTAQDAIQCIKDRNYADSLRLRNKPITGVGVAFSTKTKGVADWDRVEL